MNEKIIIPEDNKQGGGSEPRPYSDGLLNGLLNRPEPAQKVPFIDQEHGDEVEGAKERNAAAGHTHSGQ